MVAFRLEASTSRTWNLPRFPSPSEIVPLTSYLTRRAPTWRPPFTFSSCSEARILHYGTAAGGGGTLSRRSFFGGGGRGMYLVLTNLPLASKIPISRRWRRG